MANEKLELEPLELEPIDSEQQEELELEPLELEPVEDPNQELPVLFQDQGKVQEEVPIMDKVKDLGIKTGTSAAVGAGVYGVQKQAESLASKLDLYKKLKEATNPETLAYKGVGGDSSMRQKKLPLSEKRKIGKTILDENLGRVISGSESRLDDVNMKLEEVGEKIGNEQKRAQEILDKPRVLGEGFSKADIQRLNKATGQKLANEFQAIRDSLSNVGEIDKKAAKKFDTIIKRYKRKGVSLEQLKKDIDAFGRDAKFDRFGEAKDPFASQKRAIAQKLRVDLIETVLEQGGKNVDTIKDYNKKYHELSKAKEIIKGLAEKEGTEDIITKAGKLGKTVMKGAVGSYVAGPVGLATASLTDKPMQRTLQRTISKIGKTAGELLDTKAGSVLKKLASGAGTVGKVAWKALPGAAALMTFSSIYNEAKAAGLSDADAIKQAGVITGVDEATDFIPYVNILKMAAMPTETGMTRPQEDPEMEKGRLLEEGLISPESLEYTNEGLEPPKTEFDVAKGIAENSAEKARGTEFDPNKLVASPYTAEKIEPKQEPMVTPFQRLQGLLKPQMSQEVQGPRTEEVKRISMPKFSKDPVKGTKELIESSPDNIQRMIDSIEQNGSDTQKRFVNPLKKALEANERRRGTLMFGLIQQPEFRKLMGIKGNEKK